MITAIQYLLVFFGVISFGWSFDLIEKKSKTVAGSVMLTFATAWLAGVVFLEVWLKR